MYPKPPNPFSSICDVIYECPLWKGKNNKPFLHLGFSYFLICWHITKRFFVLICGPRVYVLICWPRGFCCCCSTCISWKCPREPPDLKLLELSFFQSYSTTSPWWLHTSTQTRPWAWTGPHTTRPLRSEIERYNDIRITLGFQGLSISLGLNSPWIKWLYRLDYFILLKLKLRCFN